MSELCKEVCPRYAVCTKLINSGTTELLLANFARPGLSGPEFETDDGRLVDSAEFFGLGGMSDEEVAAHRSAGRSLQDAGRELAALLLDGCDGEPIEMVTGHICNSRNKSAVDLTEAEIDNSASPQAQFIEDIVWTARAATQGE